MENLVVIVSHKTAFQTVTLEQSMKSQKNKPHTSPTFKPRFAVPMRSRIERRGSAIPVHQCQGWMRGKCEVKNGTIFLPSKKQNFYSFTAGEVPFGAEPLFAFLQLDINNVSEVEDFVAHYGLLTEAGLHDGQESLKTWEDLRMRFLACMKIYWAIGEILKQDGGSADAFDILYTVNLWLLEDSYTVLGQRPTPLEEYRAHLYIEAVERGCFGNRDMTCPADVQRYNLSANAFGVIIRSLNTHTQSVNFGFSFDFIPWEEKKEAAHLSPIGLITSGAVASDLSGYLAAQLGYLIQDAREVRLCSCECGRFFVPNRTDQKFFSSRCSTRLRVRKHRQNKDVLS